MSAPNSALNYQLLRLGALLQLEQRARAAGRKELEFLMVNDTATVVSYQQAVLWRKDPAGGGSLTLSGVAVAEVGGPYRIWLDQVIKTIVQGAQATVLHSLTPIDPPEALAQEWPEWFPPHALWCPLTRREGDLVGGLLLGRTDPWLDGDRQLVEMLSGSYAQSLILSDTARPAGLSRWARLRRRPVLIAHHGPAGAGGAGPDAPVSAGAGRDRADQSGPGPRAVRRRRRFPAGGAQRTGPCGPAAGLAGSHPAGDAVWP